MPFSSRARTSSPSPSLSASFALCLGLFAGPAHAGFTLASVAADGGMPDGYYSGDHPALSADGRFVAFRSGLANLVSPATSGNQIFLRDLKLGTTELVSQSDLGQYGTGSSDWPSISNDGCLIAFESDAPNLVTGDSNGLADVFVRDRCSASPTTRLVSVDSSGKHSTGRSGRPAISGDGRTVAFRADGSDLVATAPNAGQIYRRDLLAQTTVLVSDNLSQNGKGGNFGTDCPAVSVDGTRIAFWSLAYDLTAGDDSSAWDILLWDANASPHITKVSTSSAGGPQNLGDNGSSTVTGPARRRRLRLHPQNSAGGRADALGGHAGADRHRSRRDARWPRERRPPDGDPLSYTWTQLFGPWR